MNFSEVVDILPLGSIVAKVPQPEYGIWVKVEGGYQLVAHYPLHLCVTGKDLFAEQEWKTLIQKRSWVKNLGDLRDLCHGKTANNDDLMYRIFHHFMHLVLAAVASGKGIFHFPNQNKITIEMEEYSDLQEIARQMTFPKLRKFWLENFDMLSTGNKYYKCKLMIRFKGRTIKYNVRLDRENTAKFIERANSGKGFSTTKLTMSYFLKDMCELYPWLTKNSISKILNVALYRLNKALKWGEFYYFTISNEHNYTIIHKPKDPISSKAYLEKQVFKRRARTKYYGAISQQIYKAYQR